MLALRRERAHDFVYEKPGVYCMNEIGIRKGSRRKRMQLATTIQDKSAGWRFYDFSCHITDIVRIYLLYVVLLYLHTVTPYNSQQMPN